MYSPMIIQGKREEYNCFWEPRGWTYAAPIVSVRRKFLGLIPYWKKVWRGKSVHVQDPGKMYPEEMRHKYKECVEDYEAYLTAWENG